MKKNKRQRKERTTPRFGVLDAIIILLIVVAVVGVYFRYNIIDFVSATQNLEDYTIEYSIKNIRYSTQRYVDIKDDVYFASDGKYFGWIASASDSNEQYWSWQTTTATFITSSGEIKDVGYPEEDSENSRIDANGRLVCSGKYSSDGEFLVNGTKYIAAGQLIDVKTEYVSVTLCVENISPFEQN